MAHYLRGIVFGALLTGATLSSGWYAWQQIQENQILQQTQLTKKAALGPKTETPQMVASKAVDYAFTNKKMYLTFDFGKNWQQVPATMEEFFGGDFSGQPQNQLLPDTYQMTITRAGLLIVKDHKNLIWLETTDQGQTWQESVIFKDISGIRNYKINFLNKGFVAAFVTGGRVMGQEGYQIAMSHDDGQTWKTAQAKGLDAGPLMTDAGFLDEKLAFFARKTELLVSQDGGKTFTPSTIQVPERYHNIFIWPEIPTKDSKKLSLLVNQGDTGDYRGGLVKGLFESEDNGLTFHFVAEVQPEEENIG